MTIIWNINTYSVYFAFGNCAYLLFHLGNVIRKFPNNRRKFGERIADIKIKYDGKSRNDRYDKNDMKRYLEFILYVCSNNASIKTNWNTSYLKEGLIFVGNARNGALLQRSMDQLHQRLLDAFYIGERNGVS